MLSARVVTMMGAMIGRGGGPEAAQVWAVAVDGGQRLRTVSDDSALQLATAQHWPLRAPLL